MGVHPFKWDLMSTGVHKRLKLLRNVDSEAGWRLIDILLAVLWKLIGGDESWARNRTSDAYKRLKSFKNDDDGGWLTFYGGLSAANWWRWFLTRNRSIDAYKCLKLFKNDGDGGLLVVDWHFIGSSLVANWWWWFLTRNRAIDAYRRLNSFKNNDSDGWSVIDRQLIIDS